MLYLLPAFVIGGLLYRIHGGLGPISSGDFLPRMLWTLNTAALCAWCAGDPWLGLAVIIPIYVTTCLPHAWCQSTNGGPMNLDATVGMSAVILAIGLAIVVPVLFLVDQIWWPEAVCAALAGPAYWIGWRIPSTIKGFTKGTELGEAFTGALIWTGVVLSMMVQ